MIWREYEMLEKVELFGRAICLREKLDESVVHAEDLIYPWTTSEVDLFFPEIARVREEGAPGHTNFFVEARTMLNLIAGGQICWRKRPYN
jgi:hypothetical protein